MAPSHHRRVITIQAADSPNVRAGKEVIPGLLTAEEYAHRLATWDEVRKEIGLFARFWMGAQLLLFPPDWLDLAERNWNNVQAFGGRRQAKAIGCDPGEGGANSSWAVIDELGVIELRAEKTPDTTDVTDVSEELLKQHRVPAEMLMFDSGGGGKQHADRMRQLGHEVRVVAFGSPVQLEVRRWGGMRPATERIDVKEDHLAFFNRRAEMYHALSQLCDPALARANGLPGFAVPPGVTTGSARCPVHGGRCLRAQLAVMPRMTDSEGRYKLPPKSKTSESSKERSLTCMIGHSPDEADALVIAVRAMTTKAHKATVGAF